MNSFLDIENAHFEWDAELVAGPFDGLEIKVSSVLEDMPPPVVTEKYTNILHENAEKYLAGKLLNEDIEDIEDHEFVSVYELRVLPEKNEICKYDFQGTMEHSKFKLWNNQ